MINIINFLKIGKQENSYLLIMQFKFLINYRNDNCKRLSVIFFNSIVKKILSYILDSLSIKKY